MGLMKVKPTPDMPKRTQAATKGAKLKKSETLGSLLISKAQFFISWVCRRYYSQFYS